MASTLTTFDFALKERYTNDKIEDLTLAEHPFLADIAKDEDFMGDVQPIPFITAKPQGVGGVFGTAQTNQTNVKGDKWQFAVGDYYAFVTIGSKVMMASRANPGAFLENRTVEIDGLHAQVGDAYSIHAWGNGGGAYGQIDANGPAGAVITLANPADAYNFSIGMKVVFSANDGATSTDALLNGGTAQTVEGVNVSTGEITLDAAGGAAANAYVFRESEFRGNTTSDIMYGLQAYITSSDSPDALYGITAATRATQPTYYAGCRLPSSETNGLSMEERIQKLGAWMTGRFRGKGATDAYMHPEDWQNLAIALQARGIQPMKDESTKFGFMALSYIAGGKQMNIKADSNCPKGTFFALRMENFKLRSMGQMIHVVNGDGLQMLRISSDNAYEYRLEGFPGITCNAPSYSGRVGL